MGEPRKSLEPLGQMVLIVGPGSGFTLGTTACTHKTCGRLKSEQPGNLLGPQLLSGPKFTSPASRLLRPSRQV